MKVLYIIDTINPSGAEKSLSQIAANFSCAQAIFVHIYPGDMLKPYLLENDIPVYSLNIKSKYGYKQARKELKKIIASEKPDIIHSTLYRSDMVARMLKSDFPDIPLVGSFVNNSYTSLRYSNKSFLMKVKLWLAYLQDKYSAKKVDFFISNSHTIKETEGGALNISPEKIKVIYRGRDEKKIRNIDKEKIATIKKQFNLENKFVLLNVSRLIERKAQKDIIKALPEVLEFQPNSVLLIAGHGDQMENLKQQAINYGVEEKVFLLGRRNDIPEILHIADLFLYPSYAEGLPGALIEAMLAGKVIIASDIPENLECINERCALIYPKGDIQKLTSQIKYAVNNQDKIQNLAQNARKEALKKFDIISVAKEYESLYASLIS